jgi:hypothetical protein
MRLTHVLSLVFPVIQNTTKTTCNKASMPHPHIVPFFSLCFSLLIYFYLLRTYTTLCCISANCYTCCNSFKGSLVAFCCECLFVCVLFQLGCYNVCFYFFGIHTTTLSHITQHSATQHFVCLCVCKCMCKAAHEVLFAFLCISAIALVFQPLPCSVCISTLPFFLKHLLTLTC